MEEKKKIFHSRPLFYGFLALMLAVATSKFLFDGNLKYIIFDVVILLCFFAYALWSKKFVSLLVVFGAFLFGTGWFFVGETTFYGKTYDGTCSVVGRVSDDFQTSKYGNSVTVVLKDVFIDGENAKNIRLQIDIEDGDEIAIGDVIAFEAPVLNVNLFSLGNFNSFYYRDDTPYECNISSDDLIVQGSSIALEEQFRLKIKDELLANMSEDDAMVAYAVLFGDKSGVDDEIYSAYSAAGILHLLTVSGLHVGFLIALLGVVLKKCKIKGLLNFAICLVFLFVYAALCNFSPSILRAGIMGLILMSAQISGKCYDSLNSVGLAGIIIVLIMPLSPLDLGFLMSFFCVLSIYIISPWLSKLFRKVFPKFVADSFAISVGIQIGITPFLAQMMSNFNFLTFFVNLLAVPFFSVVFPLLFVSVLLTALLPFMGFLVHVSGWGLQVIEILAKFFGETSLQVNLDPFSIFFTAALFAGLFILSRYCMASKRGKTLCCSGMFLLSGILFGLNYIHLSADACLAYGFSYSNSTVIMHSSTGQTLIIDCVGKTFARKIMNQLNIKQIDVCFVLQDTTYNIDASRELGIKQVVRSDSGQGYDEEVLVELEQSGAVGDFSFVYKTYNDKLLGLEIAFDDVVVFVFKDKKIASAAMNAVAEEDYDFVILGNQVDNAGILPYNCNVLTYLDDPAADSSFQKDGNVAYLLGNKNNVWRGLD